MTFLIKSLTFVITLAWLTIANAQELEITSDGIIHSNRNFYTVSFDELTFRTTYNYIDTAGLSFNVNVSNIVIKNFFPNASTVRGAGESGSFLRTVIDNSDGSTSQVSTGHAANSGVTDTTLGIVSTSDLILNLEDDTFIIDDGSFTVSGSALQFSVASPVTLPTSGVYQVYLTNDAGEQLSELEYIIYGEAEQTHKLLAGYDFDTGNNTPTTAATYEDVNVTASEFAVGPGLISIISANANALNEVYDAEGNILGTSNAISFGGARDALGFSDDNNNPNLSRAITDGDYMSFTITPSSILELDLHSLSFRSRVNNLTNSAQYWALMSSIDGFTEGAVIQSGQMTVAASYVNNIIDLSNSNLSGITEPVTFRLYIHGGDAASSSATLFDKIVVQGSYTRHEEILAGYDFDDGSSTPTTAVSYVASNVAATDYGVGPGLNSFISNNGNGLNSENDAEGFIFGTNNPISFGGSRTDFGFSDHNNNANLASSITNGDYMSFTLTPGEIHELNLYRFTFRSRVNSLNNGANRWALMSSVGGFTNDDVIASGQMAQASSYTNNVIDLTTEEFIGISEPVTFRLYIHGGNSTSSSATLFDKIIVHGSVTEKPLWGYEAWLVENGSDFTATPPMGYSSGSDRLPNLMKYILGANTDSFLYSNEPKLILSTENQFKFTRNIQSAYDTTQIVEYSSDLTPDSWTLLSNISAEGAQQYATTTPGLDGTEEVTVDISSISDETENKKCFFRLSAVYTGDAE